MTEDMAGFVGDPDLAKVDLEIIKRLFPEWCDEGEGSTPNGESSLSLLVAPSNIRMA